MLIHKSVGQMEIRSGEGSCVVVTENASAVLVPMYTNVLNKQMEVRIKIYKL